MKPLTALIWKEAHEQAWKLALGCIVLGAFAGIGLHTRIIPDAEMLVWVCFPAAGLLPLLACIGLIPAERDAGTFEALLALPAPLRTVLAVKTGAGLLLSTVPLAVALLVSLLVAGGREMGDRDMLLMFARAALSATALFVWMFAGTLRLPGEARASLVCVGVVLFWCMASAGLTQLNIPLLSAVSPVSFLANGIRDPGWVNALNDPNYRVTPLSLNAAVQAAIVVLLWVLAARSVGRTDDAASK